MKLLKRLNGDVVVLVIVVLQSFVLRAGRHLVVLRTDRHLVEANSTTLTTTPYPFYDERRDG